MSIQTFVHNVGFDSSMAACILHVTVYALQYLFL